MTLVLNFFVGLAGASSFSVGEYSPVIVILSDGTATVFAIDMMPNSGGAVTASVCHRGIPAKGQADVRLVQPRPLPLRSRWYCCYVSTRVPFLS